MKYYQTVSDFELLKEGLNTKKAVENKDLVEETFMRAGLNNDWILLESQEEKEEEFIRAWRTVLDNWKLDENRVSRVLNFLDEDILMAVWNWIHQGEGQVFGYDEEIFSQIIRDYDPDEIASIDYSYYENRGYCLFDSDDMTLVSYDSIEKFENFKEDEFPKTFDDWTYRRFRNFLIDIYYECGYTKYYPSYKEFFEMMIS